MFFQTLQMYTRNTWKWRFLRKWWIFGQKTVCFVFANHSFLIKNDCFVRKCKSEYDFDINSKHCSACIKSFSNHNTILLTSPPFSCIIKSINRRIQSITAANSCIPSRKCINLMNNMSKLGGNWGWKNRNLRKWGKKLPEVSRIVLWLLITKVEAPFLEKIGQKSREEFTIDIIQ